MKDDVFNILQIALLSRINNQLSSVSAENDDSIGENTMKYDAKNYTVRINTSISDGNVAIVYNYSNFRMVVWYTMNGNDNTFKTPFAENEIPSSMCVSINADAEEADETKIVYKSIDIYIPSLNEDYTYTFSESDIVTNSLISFVDYPHLYISSESDGIHLEYRKSSEKKGSISISYDNGQHWSETSTDIVIQQYGYVNIMLSDYGTGYTIPILDLDYNSYNMAVAYELS